MWITLLACQEAPSTPSSAPQPQPTTSPPVTSPLPTDTGPPPPKVPMINIAMREVCPEAFPGDPLPVGDDLKKVTLNGVGRCNDGTPPVLYVRAASDPDHLNDWAWFFDGGNNCGEYLGCQIRWCNYNPPFGRRHMSSTTYNDTIAGEGIFSAMPENEFASWNHVYAVYCTSDSWTGQASDVVFDDKKPAYRVHFEGALVAADGIAAGVAGLVSDDGSVVMPLLSDANHIVSACTSSGCQGAINNSDVFEAAVPTATVTTVIDSSFFAAPEVLPVKYYTAIEGMLTRMWTEVAEPVWGASPDPECAAENPGEEWKCQDMDVMARGHLSRVVQHVDQDDPIVYDFYALAGLEKIEYATAVVGTFRLYEKVAPHISVHSNNCGIHAAIDMDGTFMNYTVVDAVHPGEAFSLHDVLLESLAGNHTVAIDSIPPTTSVCGLKP